MRNDFEGEARRLRAAEECAIGDTMPPWGCVWAARGEEARCRGSGDEEPEREDIGCICVALSSRSFTLERCDLFCCVLIGGVACAYVLL